MSQEQRVLKYMKDFGSITGAEAFLDLGVYRLSAVIYNLRDKGYKIESEKEEGKNRYGEKTRYSRYRLNQEPVQTQLF